MLIEHISSVITLDDEDRVLEPGWIRVESGEITEVSSTAIDPRPGEERIDGADRAALPGLVNAHTHLYQTLIRGVYEGIPFSDWLQAIYRTGTILTEDDFYAGARLGSLEALKSGTTTVLEHHFLNRGPGLAEASLEGMLDSGIRTVFARTSMDIGDLAPAAVLETPEQAIAAADGLLRHADGSSEGMLTFMVGPNTPGLSSGPAMIRAIGEFAVDRRLRQSMHVSESRASRARVRDIYGVDGVVRWLDKLDGLVGPVIAAHAVHIDEGEISLLAERGGAIAHNPVSNLFLGDGFAPIWEARKGGVLVALGTDGAASNNTQDMFEVVKVSGLLQRARREDGAAVTAREALRMATADAAEAVGLGRLIGSLVPGKRADIVLVELMRSPRMVALHDTVSQIVHCARGSDVSTVLVDGNVVVADGRAVGVDEEALLARSQAIGRSIVGRLQ